VSERTSLCPSQTLTALKMTYRTHEVDWDVVDDGDTRCNECIVAQPSLRSTPGRESRQYSG